MDTGGSDIPIQERFIHLVVLSLEFPSRSGYSGVLTFAEPLE